VAFHEGGARTRGGSKFWEVGHDGQMKWGARPLKRFSRFLLALSLLPLGHPRGFCFCFRAARGYEVGGYAAYLFPPLSRRGHREKQVAVHSEAAPRVVPSRGKKKETTGPLKKGMSTVIVKGRMGKRAV